MAKKPEPKTKAPESTKPMAKDANALSYVNPKAMSVDVGKKAVEAFKATKDVDAQISELAQQNTAQKGQTLAGIGRSVFRRSD